MAISIPTPINRVFAFFTNIWSFILTLARSLLALFASRRRSRDPLALPRVNRTQRDALTRAHRHLRPILLTPRTLTLSSPFVDAELGRGTRTPSALTLFPGVNGNTSPVTAPQRTSPKLDPNDNELGPSTVLSLTSVGLNSHNRSVPGSAGTGTGVLAVRTTEGTPETDNPTPSFSTLPLTPPDPCYLGPRSSTTDLPYAEPWPTNSAFDGHKQKLPRSPLRTTFGNESRFPNVAVQTWNPDFPPAVLPDGHWNPVPIWTSTPRKHEKENMPPVPIFGDSPRWRTEDIPHTIATRTRPTNGPPYDDASLYSTSSTSSADHDDRMPRQVPIPRPKANVAHLSMYAWRRHGARLPGKHGGTTRAHSQSHLELSVNRPFVEWYDAGAYVTSPSMTLSPPLDKDVDEDEVPLGYLIKLRARQSVGIGVRKPTAFGGKRTASEESLFITIDTPTKMGGRKVREGNGVTSKDVFEIPPLQLNGVRATAPIPARSTDVFSVDGSARDVSAGVEVV